jgi:hypothetical protein
MKRIAALVGLVGALAIIAPSAASAQSSTCQSYNVPALCGTVGGNTTGTTTTPPVGTTTTTPPVGTTTTTPPAGTTTNCPTCTTATTVSAGTLPFTGLDVVLLVAGGAMLLAAGFLVRRLSRRLN